MFIKTEVFIIAIYYCKRYICNFTINVNTKPKNYVTSHQNLYVYYGNVQFLEETRDI